ncbi:helix-turn-helix transcriptional regulator [Variovorax sp. J31P207]|uniref:helix-turn-helix domain-containing protein n=1 Tax=Variovorax sp. J31P207 TaxID=3053510 RepID=UPI002578BE7F|nr:helix-turn-helix transcriptional regulator [Variovorax sp. J31P207]MDM0064966.1 helix-turn-helix transcriptional regulator [Variovorax sp. J31P207]
MSEVTHLVATIKRKLKSQGLTYRDVAHALKLSEPTVKRLFSGKRLSVERLARIGELLGFTMAELLEESASSVRQLRMLTWDQEAHLVSDMDLMLVATCALNHWTLSDIVATYRMSEAECLKQLLVLDRMGLIELLPGDRIRLRIARDFDWIPTGPIQTSFVSKGLSDFLDCRLDQSDTTLHFSHGMLTDAAFAEFQGDLRVLRAKLAKLHQESVAAPLALRRGTGVLLAMREWEPRTFEGLRRSSTP